MTTLTERLVTGLSTRWAAKKVGRRSLLAGAAVVGSALATHPVQYATRPLSAMATVCGDGAACNEGWSAFCCTVTGANQCPPGSFVAGWWKADRSGFCCGSARYYIDCNASCASGWKCHCASGTCDQRRVACNQFRYGQCHQEISCYGPVVCRVVTCTPPWQFDKACGTTSLTDNRTVNHSAPCLLGTCPSTLDEYWYDHGGPGGELGKSMSPERNGVSGSRYHHLAHAVIYTLAGEPVQRFGGDMLTLYRNLGGSTGTLGYPTSRVTTAGATTRVSFQRGAIYRSSASGTHSVRSPLYSTWSRVGGVNSGIGLPMAEQKDYGHSRFGQRFVGGGLFYTPSGGGRLLRDAYWAKWLAIGGVNAGMGLPVTDVTSNASWGRVSLENGAIYSGRSTGVHYVPGALYRAFVAAGAVAGMGLPRTDPYVTGSKRRIDFQKGSLVLDPATGKVVRA